MAQAKHNLPEASNGTMMEKEKDSNEDKEAGSVTIPECAVCLQPCIHPARLPCNHIYCYLCVKGVANHNKRCPMCRQEMPSDFVERPQLVEVDEVKELERPEEEYQWFYEGRNGWWKYDSRINKDLETVYELGETKCEMLICGILYVIDFEKKCQHRKYQPRYKRNIKRDRKDAQCKGVSGWWQYDQRTSLELETAYKQGKRTCDLLIAGFLYIADFGSMHQLRRNDPSRRRRIKRDLYNVPKKGVAGLRLNVQEEEMIREIRGAERPASPESDTISGDGTSTPIPPSNTPQTPAGGTASGDATPLNDRMDQRSDSLHQVLEQMRSLVLIEHLSFNSNNDLEETAEDESVSEHSILSCIPTSHESDEDNL
ncbi:E3 ubiquitin-protein ligase RNF146 isoform X1 [Polistes fuscatus]|uniref:E3 ubiquitin-protein ligase RNF146 isoform X1 n=1 Tax=Polistes fuscatus TaxID=30207 RepID=UPI001CA91F4C|nr:E3 ubiquitin-protein ligase RNF146 isoform X1 [Polistes fuscatus]XP_043501362.1 E3 ubiquitin-protein ligase RNF146 isoform X1 [Polistes fuscatus]